MNVTFKKVAKIITVSLTLTLAFSTSIAYQPHKAEAAMSAATLADNIINTANRYKGTPYLYGSPSGVASTFDCSSFTQFVFLKNGIYLPRRSNQQATLGFKVTRYNLKRGDLVFFRTPTSNAPDHVGIYTGNGYFIHTYGPGGVKYASLNNSWWSSHFIAGRRILHY